MPFSVLLKDFFNDSPTVYKVKSNSWLIPIYFIDSPLSQSTLLILHSHRPIAQLLHFIKSTLILNRTSVSVSHSFMSDSLRPHGLQPTRLLRPWDFPGKDTGVVCHLLLQNRTWSYIYSIFTSICVWLHWSLHLEWSFIPSPYIQNSWISRPINATSSMKSFLFLQLIPFMNPGETLYSLISYLICFSFTNESVLIPASPNIFKGRILIWFSFM